jgi:hypothetical protein
MAASPGKLIRRTAVSSRALRSVGYDKSRSVLQVELVNGAIYDYLDVPQQEYAALLNAQSKGQCYNWLIKPNHSYRQVRAA